MSASSDTRRPIYWVLFQFSCSVTSDFLQPHESQHTRAPCPSPTHGVHTHSRPSSQWCHSAIPCYVVPFCSCPQSLPTSESFPMSQLFAWGGQSTGVSALASFLSLEPVDMLPYMPKAADIISDQMTLRLDYSGWERRKRQNQRGRWRAFAAGFEDGGRSHKPRNEDGLSRLEKAR